MDFKDILEIGFEPLRLHSQANLHTVADEVMSSVSSHIKNSHDVRTFLTDIPKGEGTYCSDSPIDELVNYAAEQITEKGIDKNDPLVNIGFMEKIVHPVFTFERKQMLSAIQVNNTITDVQKKVIEGFVNLAEAVDLFWMKWYKKVVVPLRSLEKGEQEEWEKIFEKKLSQYDYTVFDLGDGEILNRETWAEAFEGEITQILGTLERVKFELGDSDPVLKKYLDCLFSAYACTELSELEEKWAAVDEAWIKLPNDCQMIPVHGMENRYEHPACVSPEVRLEHRVGSFKEKIDSIRRSTLDFAKSLGLDDSLIGELEKRLQNVDVDDYITLIRSGVDMNFRLSGQVVPNREEIRSQGSKIFLALATTPITIKIYSNLLKKHLTKNSDASLLAKSFTPELLVVDFVAGHECAHPVGCTDDVTKELGDDHRLLEEAKATMFGVSVSQFQNKMLTHRVDLAILLTARLLRFTQKATMSNETIAAYVRECLVAGTILFRSGVISMSRYGLKFDSGMARDRSWIKEINNFIKLVLKLYEKKDRDGLKKLMEEYCDASEGTELARLIKWSQRE